MKILDTVNIDLVYTPDFNPLEAKAEHKSEMGDYMYRDVDPGTLSPFI